MNRVYYLKKKKNKKYTFNGCYVFRNTKLNKNLLISLTGTNMLVDNTLVKKIRKDEINDDLLLKLIQRGFVEYNGSRKIINGCDSIKPTFFLLDLTEKCNLNCIYCFRNLKGRRISEETV